MCVCVCVCIYIYIYIYIIHQTNIYNSGTTCPSPVHFSTDWFLAQKLYYAW
jgi:hypothetical protein